MYHRVLPEADPFAIGALTVEQFRRQVEVLAQCFKVVSLEQLITGLAHGRLPPGTACITFDDGYLDNYTFAYPILEQYNVPATIFLASDVIGTNRILWHDRVLRAFKNTQVREFHYGDFSSHLFRLPDILAKQELALKLLEWLKQFAPAQRDHRISEILSRCEIDENRTSAARLMLAWQEVREMHQNGITFGAHTKSHPILALLTREQKTEEIGASKRVIEDNLGAPVTTFAYPNGRAADFDDETKQILKQANFRCAVTTCHGLNTAESDPFEWRREQPWETQPDKFLARLLWARLTEG